MEGFIRIPNSFYEKWEGYPKVVALAVHLLFKAAWKDGAIAGQEILRGQLLTSVSRLSQETQLTSKEIRNALNLLKKANFLGKVEGKVRGKVATLVTICDYDSYNGSGQGWGKVEGKVEGKVGARLEEKLPPLSPPKDVSPTTPSENTPPYNPPSKEFHQNGRIKETLSIESEKKNGGSEIFDFSEGLTAPVAPREKPPSPTPSPKKIAYAEFVHMTEEEYGRLVEKYGKEGADWMIEKLDNAKGSKGYKYKSDYRAILSWVVKEYEKQKSENNGDNRTQYQSDTRIDRRRRAEGSTLTPDEREASFYNWRERRKHQ